MQNCKCIVGIYRWITNGNCAHAANATRGSALCAVARNNFSPQVCVCVSLSIPLMRVFVGVLHKIALAGMRHRRSNTRCRYWLHIDAGRVFLFDDWVDATSSAHTTTYKRKVHNTRATQHLYALLHILNNESCSDRRERSCDAVERQRQQ